MAQITTGLPSNGTTRLLCDQLRQLAVPASGLLLALGLLASCESDFSMMQGWFGGIDIPVQLPPAGVQISNAGGGASWVNSGQVGRAVGLGTSIQLNPGTEATVTLLRYLLVSEVTDARTPAEQRMDSTPNTFGAGDEGVSARACRVPGDTVPDCDGSGEVPASGFGVATRSGSNNTPRADFIDVNNDDNQPDANTGCTALCFSAFSPVEADLASTPPIAAGSSTLEGVYQNLTGKTGAFSAFSGLVNTYYPATSPCDPTNANIYGPAGDNIFPVSDLLQWDPPGPITCGYNADATIVMTKPAMANLKICLSSENTSLVTVPTFVIIPTGPPRPPSGVQTVPMASTFSPTSVVVQASYAGNTISMPVQVVPPELARLTVSPASVVCGSNSRMTIYLTNESIMGNVVVGLSSADPNLVTVPTQETISPGQPSYSFFINTVGSTVPFRPLGVDLRDIRGKNGVDDSYGDTSSRGWNDQHAHGGAHHHRRRRRGDGNGDAAPGSGYGHPGGRRGVCGGAVMPLQSNSSYEATVPASITIPAGRTSGTFSIKTKSLTSQTSKVSVQIMATAGGERYAGFEGDQLGQRRESDLGQGGGAEAGAGLILAPVATFPTTSSVGLTCRSRSQCSKKRP